MLHWQRKKITLRTQFWLNLFLFSALGHLFALGGLLVWYNRQCASVIVNVKRSVLDDATIVLLPFCKRVKQPRPNPSIHCARAQHSGRTAKRKPRTQLKKSKPVKKKKVTQKVVERKPVKAKAKKLQQKAQQEKIMYVGQEDLRALNLEAAIQKEVKRFWKPPAGLPKNLSCTFSVRIDERGHVARIKVLDSSKVLVYDACARTALGRMTFPRVAYHKEITMVF